jgi:hypothetical protein
MSGFSRPALSDAEIGTLSYSVSGPAMFIFVLYALAVWFAAFRRRREWESLAAVGLGALGLLIVAWVHYLLGVWTNGDIRLAVLQSMLYPYAALVIGVGLYLASMPQVLASPVRCLGCNYDMHSLDEPDAICPECGRRLHPPRHPAVRVNPEAPARRPRPAGPAPVVLRWSPVEVPAAIVVTDR